MDVAHRCTVILGYTAGNIDSQHLHDEIIKASAYRILHLCSAFDSSFVELNNGSLPEKQSVGHRFNNAFFMYYWDSYKLHDIHKQALEEIVFDISV